MTDIDKIDMIARHIRNVQDNCLTLGKKMIVLGHVDIGRKLIANGFIHDNSKFYATEFENLDHYTGLDSTPERKLKLQLAVSQHNQSNPHHPEYWGKIQDMPSVYLAECVCDWKSRAEEFGTSLMDWVNGGAMKRFKFTKEETVYIEIVKYSELLCDKPFIQI